MCANSVSFAVEFHHATEQIAVPLRWPHVPGADDVPKHAVLVNRETLQECREGVGDIVSREKLKDDTRNIRYI